MAASKGPSVASKCVQTVRQEGLGSLCRKAARRLGEWLLVANSADWYCVDLSTMGDATERATGARSPGAPRVEFDHTPEVIEWLRALRTQFGWVCVESELEVAAEAGHVFPLIQIAEGKAGYLKVGTAKCYVSDYERCISIPPGTAFIYDTFVGPQFRGRGLAKSAIGATLAFLRNRDIHLVWCHIPRWNRASVKAYSACGFARVGRVRFLKLLGLRFFSRSPERLMRRVARRAALEAESRSG